MEDIDQTSYLIRSSKHPSTPYDRLKTGRSILIEACGTMIYLPVCGTTTPLDLECWFIMPRAIQVYQEKLSKLGYGTPLWRPEPTQGEVTIGDVGRIHPVGGHWDRFFNVFHAASHEINSESVPDKFMPLHNGIPPIITMPRQLPPSVYSNESIRMVGIGGNVAAAAAAGSVVQYTCVKESGALLALQSDGNQEICVSTQGWPDYMARNYPYWHQWAEAHRSDYIDTKEIILVTGWVKARDWYVASFENQDTALRLSLEGEVPYLSLSGAIFLRTEQKRSPEYRKSVTFRTIPPKTMSIPLQPDVQQVPPRDCVFLSAIRLKMRRRVIHTVSTMFGISVKGQRAGRQYFPGMHGSVQNSSSGDASSGNGAARPSGGQVDSCQGVIGPETEEFVPVVDPEYLEIKVKLPVDRILDHLLESTDADIAIAHDVYLHPITGKPIEYSHLDDEALKKQFPCMVTASGVATVDIDALRAVYSDQDAVLGTQVVSEYILPLEYLSPSEKLTTAELPFPEPTRAYSPNSIQDKGDNASENTFAESPFGLTETATYDPFSRSPVPLSHPLPDTFPYSVDETPAKQNTSRILVSEDILLSSYPAKIERTSERIQSRLEAARYLPDTGGEIAGLIASLLHKWIGYRQGFMNVVTRSLDVAKRIGVITEEFTIIFIKENEDNEWNLDNKDIIDAASGYLQPFGHCETVSRDLARSLDGLIRLQIESRNEIEAHLKHSARKKPSKSLGSSLSTKLRGLFRTDSQQVVSSSSETMRTLSKTLSTHGVGENTALLASKRSNIQVENPDSLVELIEGFKGVISEIEEFSQAWSGIAADVSEIRERLSRVTIIDLPLLTVIWRDRMGAINTRCLELSQTMMQYQTELQSS